MTLKFKIIHCTKVFFILYNWYNFQKSTQRVGDQLSAGVLDMKFGQELRKLENDQGIK